MSRFPRYLIIALTSLTTTLTFGVLSVPVGAQNAPAFRKPLQSAGEIAELPKSASFSPRNSGTVRVGFAPQSSGQGSSFGQASNSRTQAQADVYPYPASTPSRASAASRSNNSLSRNTADARFASRSFGANSSTGNLGNFGPPARTAQAQQAYNIRENSTLGNTAQQTPPTQQTPPSQQTPPAQQTFAKQNQARANPGWTNPGRTNARSNAPNSSNGYNNNVFSLNRFNAVPRVSSRAPVEQQRSSTLSQKKTSASGVGSQSNTNQTQPTTAFRQAAYQAPSLRTAQNCNCAPNYQVPNGYGAVGYNPTAAGYQTPALSPAVGTGLAAPAQNLQFQQCYNRQYVPQAGQGFQFQQGIGTPQFGAQGARWWTPFVYGSGVYTPLLRLQNMPAGTYLGQGIIGQPTAYVDGQPIRNLLRYVAP